MDKPIKRRRRMALITIVDYLTKLDGLATTKELHKMLADNGINITLRTLQRWMRQWCRDNKWTAISCTYSKRWEPYLYTAYKCADTRSYERIVHMVDRYMGA